MVGMVVWLWGVVEAGMGHDGANLVLCCRSLETCEVVFFLVGVPFDSLEDCMLMVVCWLDVVKVIEVMVQLRVHIVVRGILVIVRVVPWGAFGEVVLTVWIDAVRLLSQV